MMSTEQHGLPLGGEKCNVCEDATEALSPSRIAALFGSLDNGWRVVDGHHLERKFKFSDFRRALAFTNVVGNLAEVEGHHPDILLSWGKVEIYIWTHSVDGLTRNDFVLASKISRAYRQSTDA